MAEAIINGVKVKGTPEEIARLMQLAKSQGGDPAPRMPRWVDKTHEKAEAAK